ncbi:hypothetical protein ACLKA6_008474 [Drosophila palustris]
MNIINQTPETPEMREIPSVFRKSGVTARSPVNTPAQGGTEEARVDMTKELTPKELILKMRALEEESLLQCKAVLRKMKLAMLKQRNISMDVKDENLACRIINWKVLDIYTGSDHQYISFEVKESPVRRTETTQRQNRRNECPTLKQSSFDR